MNSITFGFGECLNELFCMPLFLNLFKLELQGTRRMEFDAFYVYSAMVQLKYFLKKHPKIVTF